MDGPKFLILLMSIMAGGCFAGADVPAQRQAPSGLFAYRNTPEPDLHAPASKHDTPAKTDLGLSAGGMNLSQISNNRLVQREEAATTRVEPLQASNVPVLKSYADVQALLNDFMKRNNGPIEFAPHGAFWNEMSHKQFIEGNVPDVTDPATGKPVKILMVRNSRGSNLIMVLRRTKGSIFDPETGSIGRMPPTGPFMSDEEINRLADWIDRGCPDKP